MFALINSYLKPIVKALSFPISMMTLGLVAFVINAAMLLVVALVSETAGARVQGRRLPAGLSPPMRSSGPWPASIIISIVSTVATIALSPRKLF